MQHFDIFPLTDFRRFLLNSNQFYTKFILSASNLLEYIACAGSQNQSQYFSLNCNLKSSRVYNKEVS